MTKSLAKKKKLIIDHFLKISFKARIYGPSGPLLPRSGLDPLAKPVMVRRSLTKDLLSTVNKPEWPAAGEMLTILGKMLVRNFLNRKVDISLRTASLEYLGVVAARLRKDALTSEKDVADVRPIVAIVDHGVEGKDTTRTARSIDHSWPTERPVYPCTKEWKKKQSHPYCEDSFK